MRVRASGAVPRGAAVLKQARTELVERLRARRSEIEQATLTRIYAISDPGAAPDPAYAEGLRIAAAAGLDFGLEGIERGEERAPAAPLPLLGQARAAVRNGVSLDTVLRRYFAGYALLTDFIVQEAEQDSLLSSAELGRLLRSQAALFDRLLAAVGDEYVREAAGRADTSEKHRAERVRRLLAGELVDSATLAYDFDVCHLGLVATGPGAAEGLHDLAASLERRLLLVRPDQHQIWAWLGGRRAPDLDALDHHLAANWPGYSPVARGEPAQGLAGWRLSHRQAAAALPVALRGPTHLARYSDVMLLAAALQDELLVASVRRLYLEPLQGGGDGGESAKETLRAYFAAGRNVSSAAAALGIARRTVAARLRVVEELIGRPVDRAGAELEIALSLDELADDLPVSLSA